MIFWGVISQYKIFLNKNLIFSLGDKQRILLILILILMLHKYCRDDYCYFNKILILINK